MARRGNRGNGKGKGPSSTSAAQPAEKASTSASRFIAEALQSAPEYHPRRPLPLVSTTGSSHSKTTPNAGGLGANASASFFTRTQPSSSADGSPSLPPPPPPPPPYPAGRLHKDPTQATGPRHHLRPLSNRSHHYPRSSGTRAAGGAPRTAPARSLCGPPLRAHGREMFAAALPPPLPPAWMSPMQGTTSPTPLSPSTPHRGLGSPSSCFSSTLFPSATHPNARATAYAFDEEGMSRELFDFSAYAALSPSEHAQRQSLIHAVAKCAAELWPTMAEEAKKTQQQHLEAACGGEGGEEGTCVPPPPPPPRQRFVVTRELVVYGSYALGLSLPSSDVDMCVALGLPLSAEPRAADSTQSPIPTPHVESDGSPTPSPSREGSRVSTASSVPSAAQLRQRRQLEALYDLADHILVCYGGGSGGGLHLEVHDQCRVPVIKLRDTRSGISADISVSIRKPLLALSDPQAEPQYKLLPMEEAVRRQRAWLHPTQWPASSSTPSVSSFITQQGQDARVFTQLAAMLILTTKAALRQWGLNNLFSGGVSSTALYSLVHRYLHTRRSHNDARQPLSAKTGQPSACGGSSRGTGDGADEEEEASMYSPTTSHAPGISEDGDYASHFMTGTDSHSHTTTAGSRSSMISGSASGESVRSGATARSTPIPFTASDVSDTESLSSSKDHDRQTNDDAHTDGDADATICVEARATDGSAPASAFSTRSSVSGSPFSLALPKVSCKTERGSAGVTTSLDARHTMERCVELFGVSPARLLLNFWRYLSADVFMFGYDVFDAFATDSAPPPTSADAGVQEPTRAPSLASSMEQSGAELRQAVDDDADVAPLYDLTAPSFRLPELLALFRCTCSQLEGAVDFDYHRKGQAPVVSAVLHKRKVPCTAASPLSLVLVDPRALTASEAH